MSLSDSQHIYRSLIFRRLIISFSFISLVFITFIINVSVGSSGISIDKVFASILGFENDRLVNTIVWTYRIPWSLMAIVVGFSLGIAGVVMQTILNNPLASPYTLGISSGAGFGAALVYALGLSLINIPYAEEFIVPLNAFIFAFLTCLLIILIGKVRGFTYETLILAGIAISFLFHSLLSLMEYFATEEALQAIVFWLFGSLLKATYTKILAVFIVMLTVLTYLIRRCWELTTLRLGDERAKSLGVNPEKLRLEALLCVSILTSIAVCFVGIIGFIGLVAPHIARFLVGEDSRFLIPMSGLVGSSILSASAIACKTIIPGAIIPIGIVTSFVGVPFFTYLIIKGRRGVW